MPHTDLVLAALLTALWAAWLAHRGPARGSSTSVRSVIKTAPAAMIAALCTAPQVWPRVWTGYRGDSLYDLGLVGSAGLMLLSAGMVLVLFWLAAVKTRWLEARSPWLLLADPPLAILLFMVSFMITPQLYYIYYVIMIPNLPIQWVATRWIGPLDLLSLARLPAAGSASDHLSGLALRALVLAALWRPGLRLIAGFGLSPRIRIMVVAVAAALFAAYLPALLALPS